MNESENIELNFQFLSSPNEMETSKEVLLLIYDNEYYLCLSFDVLFNSSQFCRENVKLKSKQIFFSPSDDHTQHIYLLVAMNITLVTSRSLHKLFACQSDSSRCWLNSQQFSAILRRGERISSYEAPTKGVIKLVKEARNLTPPNKWAHENGQWKKTVEKKTAKNRWNWKLKT